MSTEASEHAYQESTQEAIALIDLLYKRVKELHEEAHRLLNK